MWHLKILYRVCYVFLVACHFVLSFDVKKGYFWQVTDFHYDANYSTSGDPKHMCHNIKGQAYTNSEYGNYLCDSPLKLVESAIQAMKDIHSDPDFIAWTGDSVPHVSDSDLNQEKVYKNIAVVTLKLREIFPNTTIYPVLGNHDEYPSNHYPSGSTDYYNNILMLSHWDQLLDTNSSEQFKTGGYYSTMTSTGLLLIGLNTNLYLNLDPLTKTSDDPAGQFKWLREQLQQAYINNVKVMVIAHIAPGYFENFQNLMWFYERYNEIYVEILRKHNDIIATQIYGHEHTDSFRILKDIIHDHDAREPGKPIGMMYMSPAVTPWKSTLQGVGANNPGIRLYEYNQENGDIINYWQYFLNLSSIEAGNSPNWTLEYEVKKDYNLKTLNPMDFMQLVRSFKHNNMSYMFVKYLQFNSVSQVLQPVCDAVCQRTQFCSIMEVTRSAYEECLQGGMTTHNPHHPTRIPPTPVPKYMEYVIICLGVLVFVLFIVIAIICLRKRQLFLPHRYTRFSSNLAKNPIN